MRRTRPSGARRARPAVAAGAAALALVLGGCSGDDASDDASTAEQATTAEDSSGKPTADDPSGDDAPGASGAAARDIDPDDVLAEVSYILPGTEDEVTVGVLPLEVEGDVMTLRLVFTPNFASVEDDEPVAVYDMYPNNAMKFRPVLVDRENLKEYSPVSNMAFDWTASTVELEAVNGEQVVWWGVYAAPEDDIDTFDLRLRDSLPEYTGIPVP
ncbi:hypothetical protein [Georgenia wangjunii]|uniref:hypothetical protein n=1 Tax=Georgenia wangjunii TaxID=3117730 RepID=UPI002F265D05